MEDGLFPMPAVADVLQNNYIEARLHIDLPGEGQKRILELRDKYSGMIATPTYVIVDPVTEEIIARIRGLNTQEKFLAFLSKGM